MRFCERDGKKYVLFWHEYEENGLFSNWYESVFVMDDFRYLHAEQYIMAMKAKTFRDSVRYTAILRADTPKECKALGKQVYPFDYKLWAKVRPEVLITALREKFGQNEALKKALLETGDAVLAEASPYDEIFGIGLTADKAMEMPEEEWPGKNLLGRTLMQVREEFTAAEGKIS